MTCKCGHRAICHQYYPRTAGNHGECLSPQCPCGEMVQGDD